MLYIGMEPFLLLLEGGGGAGVCFLCRLRGCLGQWYWGTHGESLHISFLGPLVQIQYSALAVLRQCVYFWRISRELYFLAHFFPALLKASASLNCLRMCLLLGPSFHPSGSELSSGSCGLSSPGSVLYKLIFSLLWGGPGWLITSLLLQEETYHRVLCLVFLSFLMNTVWQTVGETF